MSNILEYDLAFKFLSNLESWVGLLISDGISLKKASLRLTFCKQTLKNIKIYF